MKMHLNKLLTVSLILVLTTLLLPVQNVYALSCYASSCNNKNPTQYVCQNDAYTASQSGPPLRPAQCAWIYAIRRSVRQIGRVPPMSLPDKSVVYELNFGIQAKQPF